MRKKKLKPGKDYCLTELVHCKSSNEKGVIEALPVCAEKYCQKLLEISGAKLIIVIGGVARNYISKYCSSIKFIDEKNIDIISKDERYAIYLPHPNSWGKKKVSDFYSKEVIEKLCKLVEENRNENRDIEYVGINLPTDEEVKEFIKGKIEEYKKGLERNNKK